MSVLLSVFQVASIVRQKMHPRIRNPFFKGRTAGLLCSASLLASGLSTLSAFERVSVFMNALAISAQGKAERERVQGRSGKEPELLRRFLRPLLGLPDVPFPEANPPSWKKIDLGKRLFFDKSLSEDGTVSCATCHSPEKVFTDALPVSQGIGERRGHRNTPTLVNTAFQPYQFWDGRVTSLEDQALHPLENPREMGSSVERVLEWLNRVPDYRVAFQQAFSTPANRQTVSHALASFERTIFSGASPYDDYSAGNREALSAMANEGMKLFNGKAHCHVCHQGYNFSDGLFHNLGVGWNTSQFTDEGRYGITGIAKDHGAFKTPTLRQVAQTAPYMHDGSFSTLEAVVEFYDAGGKSNPHLDPLVQPLRLSAQEKRALVEFLRSLTGTVSSYQ